MTDEQLKALGGALQSIGCCGIIFITIPILIMLWLLWKAAGA